MMKRLFIFFLMICCLGLRAQNFSVTILPVTGFNLQLNSVTGFTVMNTSGAGKQVNIVYALKNNSDDVLAQGQQNGITINPGVTNFNAITHHLTYSTISSAFDVDEFGNIPYGMYRLCVDIFDALNMEPMANGCGEIEAILLSPPHLVYPIDQQEINVLNPSLTWLPPSPSVNTSFIYRIKVAEIQPNQNPFDAILNNFAVYEESNISFTGTLYPLTAQALEYGKTYAWKVSAYIGTRLVGETEVWTFRPIQPGANDNMPNSRQTVVILDAEKNKKIVTIVRTLKVQSDELINLQNLDYTIKDGQLNPVDKADVNVKAEGHGIFSFTFSSPASMDNKIYTLEVKTPKKKQLYATFLFKAVDQ
jgi:hypothetical protein